MFEHEHADAASCGCLIDDHAVDDVGPIQLLRVALLLDDHGPPCIPTWKIGQVSS